MVKAPRPPFDWRVFADATCAGLTPLVPLPLVDVALENVFRRRLPASICRARGVTPAPGAVAALGQGLPWLSARGCLMVPLALILYLLKRLSRKLLYFLAVREAANTLSAYWHRAFLLDHLARSGRLSGDGFGVEVRRAFEAVLEEAPTGALTHIARQVVRGSRHVVRSLWRARRRGADEAFPQEAALLSHQWAGIAEHLEGLVARFEQRLPTERRARELPAAVPAEGVGAGDFIDDPG